MKVQDDPTPTLSLYKNEYCWHQHSESIEISEKELRDQKLRHKKEKKNNRASLHCLFHAQMRGT
jgi:hypothetical protein